MLFGSLCTIVTNFQDSTDAIHATADHDRELNSSLWKTVSINAVPPTSEASFYSKYHKRNAIS